MSLRFRVAVGALALATPVLATGSASQAATADTPPPPVLKLSAPAKQVVYADGTSVYGGFGLRLVNSGGPFELRVTRPDYDNAPQAYERIGGVDVALPTDLPVSFNELGSFLSLKFTPLGTNPNKAFFRRIGSCIGQQADRVDPAAPAESDYPTQCSYSPYALGSLMGIQQGYAASVTDQWGGAPIRVPAGRWQVTMAVAWPWARALDIPAANRTVTSTVVVRRQSGCIVDRVAARGCRAVARTTPRPAQPSGVRPSAQRAITAGELPPGTPLPDLRALPATGFQISPNGNFLRFSATVWNGGTSPMVVDGFRTGDLTMDGYQYFFGPDGKQLPDYVKVGTFEWDARPTHLHWHFKSFAAYSLLPLGVTPQPAGHAHDVGGVDSRKEAFCLANTDAVDLAGPGADTNPGNTDLATACGDYTSLSTREVLAAGWGDTYAQFRAGQSFDLRKLPNGCYNVWVEGNPVVNATTGARTLIESDTTNNQAKRRICIGGRTDHRTIRSIQKIGLVDDPGYAYQGD
ncbi:MAG TPA: hypothetical protein VJ872_18025 [Nocardioides sp.]|nr:hypothetical protein [Nocardioides sp.]